MTKRKLQADQISPLMNWDYFVYDRACIVYLSVFEVKLQNNNYRVLRHVGPRAPLVASEGRRRRLFGAELKFRASRHSVGGLQFRADRAADRSLCCANSVGRTTLRSRYRGPGRRYLKEELYRKKYIYYLFFSKRR